MLSEFSFECRDDTPLCVLRVFEILFYRKVEISEARPPTP